MPIPKLTCQRFWHANADGSGPIIPNRGVAPSSICGLRCRRSAAVFVLTHPSGQRIKCANANFHISHFPIFTLFFTSLAQDQSHVQSSSRPSLPSRPQKLLQLISSGWLHFPWERSTCSMTSLTHPSPPFLSEI